MSKEELITRQQELTKQLNDLIEADFKSNHKVKGYYKAYWSIVKELTAIQRELDKVDNKTYDCNKWITKFIGNSYVSLKDARMDLINQIKDLHGVEVGECNTGVVGVTVYTEHKVYHYTIHAHYRVEVVKEWEEDGMFGKVTRQETRTIYQAWCSTDGETWSWRY